MNTVSWRSPSNIALVKYWGKKDAQIPMNPSISFTLDASYTETKVSFDKVNKNGEISLSVLFEGKTNAEFEVRLIKYIKILLDYIPVLKGMHLYIESSNSFPHSSGIASSASGMSALALCLVSIEQQINGTLHFIDDFYQKASFIARLGSGSAARSVYGGINLWGNYDGISNSSNDFSIDITHFCHPIFTAYGDAILIVTDKTKKVSSSVGHALMHNHPFAEMKFKRAFENTGKLLSVLKSGDTLEFVTIVEEEALWLHAMMMTSNPAYLLMEPNTIAIINEIREFRRTTHIPISFTLDAGANVHLLYPNNETEKVKAFIKQELEPYCVQKRWIDDKVGNGSVKI
jgi:diphosphomevalonate decarboxylase